MDEVVVVVDFVVDVEAVEVSVVATEEVVVDEEDSEAVAVEVTIKDHQRRLSSSVSSLTSAKTTLSATTPVERFHISTPQFTSKTRNKSERSTRFSDLQERT